MSSAAVVVTGCVAALHVVFMLLESVFWTHAKVRRSFGLSREEAETTKLLAMNQGVYNGALAAALVAGLLLDAPLVVTVLLAFVVAVGLFGAVTVKWTILVLQAIPAAVALLLLQL